jgi:hypothetical protein
MNLKLKAHLNRMDESLDALIRHLDGLSDEALHHKKGDKWSAAQVFQHLHDSEVGTTGYLSKKLQTPVSEVPKGGLSSLIRSRMLSRALRSRTNQFRVPKELSGVDERPDYEKLKTSYLKTRTTLRELLDPLGTKELSRAYFKHPRAGRLTINQTLDFLEDHLDRHFDQIKKRTNQ